MSSQSSNLRWQALRRLAVAIICFSALTAASGAMAAGESAETREAVVSVRGMMCSMCARALETRLAKLGDATAAKVNLDKEQAVVTFPPETKVTDKDIETTVAEAGFNVVTIEWRTAGEKSGSTSSAQAEFRIEGMDCERCAANLGRMLQQHPGLDLPMSTSRARSRAWPTRRPEPTRTPIAKAIESLGVFKARLITADPVTVSKTPRAR